MEEERQLDAVGILVYNVINKMYIVAECDDKLRTSGTSRGILSKVNFRKNKGI